MSSKNRRSLSPPSPHFVIFLISKIYWDNIVYGRPPYLSSIEGWIVEVSNSQPSGPGTISIFIACTISFQYYALTTALYVSYIKFRWIECLKNRGQKINTGNQIKSCFRHLPYFREYFPPLNSFLPWIVFRTCMYCEQRSQYIRLNSKKNTVFPRIVSALE